MLALTILGAYMPAPVVYRFTQGRHPRELLFARVTEAVYCAVMDLHGREAEPEAITGRGACCSIARLSSASGWRAGRSWWRTGGRCRRRWRGRRGKRYRVTQ
jgi:hypothetical protein